MVLVCVFLRFLLSTMLIHNARAFNIKLLRLLEGLEAAPMAVLRAHMWSKLQSYVE